MCTLRARQFCTCWVLVTVLILGRTPCIAQDVTLHQRELSRAWDAYRAADYSNALVHVDEVLREFRRQATRDQEKLVTDNIAVPVGAVTAVQKTTIHENGVLNDVATAYYLRGRCLDRLGKKPEAAVALAEATKLPNGRCWDERGFFWSPAEAAQLFLTHPQLADKAPHEAQTALAWEAFNARNFQLAIIHAQKCTEQFGSSATEMQRDLGRTKAVLGDGAIAARNAGMRDRIFKNGVLNDVATCYFIMGDAALQIGDKPAARAAYYNASKLSYARCFDSSGPWFWSPAEKSRDRLLDLR